AQLVQILNGIETLQLTELPTDQALTKLRRTELDMLILIPPDFAIAPARPGQTVPQIVVYGDDARPQQVAVGRQIVSQVIDRLSFAITDGAGDRRERRDRAGGAPAIRRFPCARDPGRQRHAA